MPSIQMPEATRQECAHRSTYEVSSHENGIDAVRGAGIELEDARLVAELDALHRYIDNDDAGNDTYIRVFACEKQKPGQQIQSATNEVEAAHAYTLDVSPNERCRQRPGYSAKTQHADNVAIGKKRSLPHLEGEA